MCRLVAALSIWLALPAVGNAQQTQSTVNPNVPAVGAIVEQSGPSFRANFQAVINDINALFGRPGVDHAPPAETSIPSAGPWAGAVWQPRQMRQRMGMLRREFPRPPAPMRAAPRRCLRPAWARHSWPGIRPP